MPVNQSTVGILHLPGPAEEAEFPAQQHKNVLRAIEGLESSPEFARLNFEECTYDDRGRPMPAYRITRDGFVFLAMGWPSRPLERPRAVQQHLGAQHLDRELQ
jgi:Rha family phage regulatory protein